MRRLSLRRKRRHAQTDRMYVRSSSFVLDVDVVMKPSSALLRVSMSYSCAAPPLEKAIPEDQEESRKNIFIHQNASRVRAAWQFSVDPWAWCNCFNIGGWLRRHVRDGGQAEGFPASPLAECLARELRKRYRTEKCDMGGRVAARTRDQHQRQAS